MTNTERRLQGLLMDFDLICSDEHFNRKDNDEYDVTKIQIKELLAESIQQALAEERERVVGEMKEYPKKLFELNNGKMPWVIWQGKADEEEKFTLYKLGFEDAIKILSLQYKPLTINNKDI